MLKFNNDNIITGYIKQLLAEFNLPKYRVYSEKIMSPEAKAQIEELKNCIKEDLKLDENNFTGITWKLLRLLELGDSEINIIPTVYREDYPKYLKTDTINERKETYPKYLFYAPYIKDGKIQEYVNGTWHDCHIRFGESAKEHEKVHIGKTILPKYYYYNQPELNYTKNLQIKNNIYDSYTHEYLGDYLRFQRDYNNINLMSMYNCFSNRDCEKLDLKVKVNSSYTAEFITNENYKIYMIPVKLFQKYTIAIDSEDSIEMCCGFYDKYQYKGTDDQEMKDCIEELSKATYACFNSMQFKTPVLFDKLFDIKVTLYDHEVPYLNKVATHENMLKLFIKVPITNKSSIVVLEGDYTSYNDMAVVQNRIPIDTTNKLMQKYLKEHPEVVEANTKLFNYLIKPFAEVIENENSSESEKIKAKEIIDGFPQAGIEFYNGTETLSGVSKELTDNTLEEIKNAADLVHLNSGGGIKNDELIAISSGAGLIPINKIERNKTIINFEGTSFEDLNNKLISPLQLLRTNTGVSYPFADRLIEYLVGNVVTPRDDIADNISRAKSIIKANNNLNGIDLYTPGIWTTAMQLLLYKYITEKYNTNDINHDILGYVDKDVEKLYSVENTTEAIFDVHGNRLKPGTTISQVNIYSEWEE